MKGPGLAIALLSKKPKRGEEDIEDDGMDDESGEEDGAPFDDVAREAFDAVKSGDFDAFKGALKAAIEVCMSGYDEG